MKITLLVLCILLASSSFCQQSQEISIDSVQNYIGKYVTILAHVSGVREMDKISYINLDGTYPNQKLTLVIFVADEKKFKTKLKNYNGEQVKVTGNITLYKGKSQIKLESEDQIQIQE